MQGGAGKTEGARHGDPPVTGAAGACIFSSASVLGKKNGMKKGDYILATEGEDGMSGDPWCVGFYNGWLGTKTGIRHFVVDSDGKDFRASGFRRAGKITSEIGCYLVEHAQELEAHPRLKLWQLVRRLRRELEAGAAIINPGGSVAFPGRP